MGRERCFAVFGGDSSRDYEGYIDAMCRAKKWGTAKEISIHIRLPSVSSESVQASRTLLTSSGDCFGPFCAACA